MTDVDEPTHPRSRFPERWLCPSVIVLYSLINLLVISPAGNFPLNDDWIYSESVSHFLQTSQFHLLGCAPSCFLHIALGVMACSILGFSHEILRGMTVFFGLATSLVLYLTLCKVGLKRMESALCAMLVAANPLFVNVSYSFMTDVPAMLFAGLYTFFTISGLQKQSSARIAIAGMMLCCALFVRQTFAVLAICNILLFLLGKGNSRNMQWTLLVAGVAAPLAVTFVAERMLVLGNEFIAMYQWHKGQLAGTVHQLISSPVSASAAMLERTFKIYCYFAIFCLPIIPGMITQIVRDIAKRRKLAVASLALSVAIAIYALFQIVHVNHQLMPFNQNLLRIPMVGPINLMGICVAGLKARHRLWLTIACALLAVPLMSFVISTAIRAARSTVHLMAEWWSAKHTLQSNRSPELIAVFASSLLVTTLGFLSIQTAYFDFDRYYLMALPSLLLCFALYIQHSGLKTAWVAAIILTLMLAGYSTMATQDYLAWNRARWQAIKQLENAGISPLRIDGGPEYNYLANPELIKACEFGAGYGITHRGAAPRCDWRWWPITGEDYIVSFSPVPDYETVARNRFWGGLTWNYREVLTLKHAKTP